MRIILSRQAEKYLDKCSHKQYQRLRKAIDGLAEFDGDIIKLQGRNDEYRLSKPPYRIIFTHITGSDSLYVKHIGPRGDAYKKG